MLPCPLDLAGLQVDCIIICHAEAIFPLCLLVLSCVSSSCHFLMKCPPTSLLSLQLYTEECQLFVLFLLRLTFALLFCFCYHRSTGGAPVRYESILAHKENPSSIHALVNRLNFPSVNQTSSLSLDLLSVSMHDQDNMHWIMATWTKIMPVRQYESTCSELDPLLQACFSCVRILDSTSRANCRATRLPEECQFQCIV